MNGSALIFDHGGRRIGVAVANLSPRLASPLLTLAARDGVPDWLELDKLVKEWRPGQLVVGVPYNDASIRISGGGSSESSDSESSAERFAIELETRYQLPVARIDERLTSVEAESRLREQRRSGARTKKVRTGDVDALAACVIAEMWLDQPPLKPTL
jgi:putative Holliday junction resolvase